MLWLICLLQRRHYVLHLHFNDHCKENVNLRYHGFNDHGFSENVNLRGHGLNSVVFTLTLSVTSNMWVAFPLASQSLLSVFFHFYIYPDLTQEMWLSQWALPLCIYCSTFEKKALMIYFTVVISPSWNLYTKTCGIERVKNEVHCLYQHHDSKVSNIIIIVCQ